MQHKEPRIRFWNRICNFSFLFFFSQHTQNHNSSIMQLGKDKAARLSFLQSMSILTSCAADSETNIVDSMRSIQNLLQFGIENSHSSSSESVSQHLPSHPTTTRPTQSIGKFITIVYPTLYKSIGRNTSCGAFEVLNEDKMALLSDPQN